MHANRVILYIAFAFITSGCEKPELPSSSLPGDLYLTTSTESSKRAELVGIRPTEDASKTLGTLPCKESPQEQNVREYLPEESISWIVDIQFEGDPRLDPQSLSRAFDMAWRDELGSFTEYGRDAETGKWTYLVASDGPKAVDRVKFAFDYVDVLDVHAHLPTEKVYSKRVEEIRRKLASFGTASVSTSVDYATASLRSNELHKLKSEFDSTITLTLNAPIGTKYDGRVVWDIMHCLGLQWGDMDCFHWINRSCAGDDSFFTVETTTAPGYFLPERIASGQQQFDDLVFVYSVPRCAHPEEVYEAMHRAVIYSQTRLGGEIRAYANGQPVSDPRQMIRMVADHLKKSGFSAGSDAAMQLF